MPFTGNKSLKLFKELEQAGEKISDFYYRGMSNRDMFIIESRILGKSLREIAAYTRTSSYQSISRFESIIVNKIRKKIQADRWTRLKQDNISR